MKFAEIRGNEEIKLKLIQTILDQRVSHAQLFYGPQGNHKLALAIAYAQLINCTGNPHPRSLRKDGAERLDSCGSCPSCIKYQKLVHPDLHFIYPVSTTKKITKKPKSRDFIEEWRTFLRESNYRGSLFEWYEAIGIENKQGIINAEDCNEIIHTLSYKSYESEYKVMILWMVEKLFYSAAPKILKILEEPPDKTLFILISEDPDQIISTIRSRSLMVKIPGGEYPRETTGDSVHFVTFRNWMRLCFAKDIISLVNWSNEIAKTGREHQKGLILYALKLIGTCNSINYGIMKNPDTMDEESQFILNIAPFFRSDSLFHFTQLFNTALYHIERNGHAPTLFLDVSLQATRLFQIAGKKQTR